MVSSRTSVLFSFCEVANSCDVVLLKSLKANFWYHYRSSLVFAYSVVPGPHSNPPIWVLCYSMQIGFLTLSWLFPSSIDCWWQVDSIYTTFCWPDALSLWALYLQATCRKIKNSIPVFQDFVDNIFEKVVSTWMNGTTYMCVVGQKVFHKDCTCVIIVSVEDMAFTKKFLHQNWRNPLGWWHILIDIIVSKHPFTTINKEIHCHTIWSC